MRKNNENLLHSEVSEELYYHLYLIPNETAPVDGPWLNHPMAFISHKSAATPPHGAPQGRGLMLFRPKNEMRR